MAGSAEEFQRLMEQVPNVWSFVGTTLCSDLVMVVEESLIVDLLESNDDCSVHVAVDLVLESVVETIVGIVDFDVVNIVVLVGID